MTEKSGDFLLQDAFQAIESDIDGLSNAPSMLLGEARRHAPQERGVYMMIQADEIVYVGEAAVGAKGLRDRFSKHLSGDEGHPFQRKFKEEFPDRFERRKHIARMLVRWQVIDDAYRARAVERLLIWMHKPRINLK